MGGWVSQPVVSSRVNVYLQRHAEAQPLSVGTKPEA